MITSAHAEIETNLESAKQWYLSLKSKFEDLTSSQMDEAHMWTLRSRKKVFEAAKADFEFWEKVLADTGSIK